MCTRGPLMARLFASNVCACISRMVRKGQLRCVVDAVASPVRNRQRNSQTFCQEAVVWKHLTHPNILPLLGVSTRPFQLISNWMSAGDLLEYVKMNPTAKRLSLVGAPFTFIPLLPSQQLSDVAEGLCYLHSHDVIHGDLKGVRGFSKSHLITC